MKTPICITGAAAALMAADVCLILAHSALSPLRVSLAATAIVFCAAAASWLIEAVSPQ